MEKEFGSKSGPIGVAIRGPEAINDPIIRGYDWARIIHHLRAIVQVFKDDPSVRDLDPTRSQTAYDRASATRTAVGQAMNGAWWCFRIDPTRDDSVGVPDDRINGTLLTTLADQKPLQLAALRLWDIYEQVKLPLTGDAVPQIDEHQLVELEDATAAVAKLTIDKDAFDARTQSLAVRAVDILLERQGSLRTATESLLGNQTSDSGAKDSSIVDDEAYVLISKVGWMEHFSSLKKFRSFLENNASRVRSKPLGRRRFGVHAADWVKYCAEQADIGFDALDIEPESLASAVVERRKQQVRSGRK